MQRSARVENDSFATQEQHPSLFAQVVGWLLPPSTLPGRKREYHRLLWIVAAVLAVDILMHLPGEYSLLVALILAALLPAFG